MLQRLPLAAVGPMLMRRRNATPLWLRLIRDAEAAAAAAGASLWYVPPEGYAPRAVNGPFVGRDGSGGVPAVGSGPVGWLRDRRDPSIGPELVTNGDFSNGLTGWTNGAGLTATVVAGQLQLARAGAVTPANGAFRQPIATVAGRTYRVTLDISSQPCAGVVWDNASFTFLTPVADLGTGAVQVFFVATGATSTLNLWTTNDGTTTVVDNISVREIPGSHATQSTSANRPVLIAAPGAAAAAAGFGALSFDGDDSMESASFGAASAAQPHSVVVAAQWAADTTGTAFVLADGSGSNSRVAQIRRDAGGALRVFYVGDTGVTLNATFGSVALNTPTVIELTCAADVVTVWVDGVQALQQALSASPSYSGMTGPRIGAFTTAERINGRVGLAAASRTSSGRMQNVARAAAFIMGTSYPGL